MTCGADDPQEFSCTMRQSRRYDFGDPHLADAEGIVAVGGPIDGPRLLEAYRRGIFPWSGRPVRWHSPDPRSIFWRVRLPRRLARLVRRGQFQITFDRAFEQVVRACAEHHRDEGVWIKPAFIKGYTELHELGYAHSVEVWAPDVEQARLQLVGGLYGVQVGGLFSGESMFYLEPNASKVAFAALAYHLYAIGIILFDSQVINEHTYRLGAVLVSRADYLRMLDIAVAQSAGYEGVVWPPDGGGTLAGTPLASAVIAATEPQTTAQPRAPEPRFWSLLNDG